MHKRVNKYKMQIFVVFNLLLTIGMNLAHPVTPTLLKSLDLGPHVFGVSFAMMCATNFIFALIWSQFANSMKKTKILMISSFGYGMAQILFGLAQNEVSIYIARLLSGIFAGGFQVGFMTYIVNEAEPSTQAHYITISSMIVSVGAALGFFIGGYLGDVSVRLTFMIQAGLHVVLGLLMYLVLGPEEVMEESSISFNDLKKANPFAVIRDAKHLLKGALFVLLMITFITSIGTTLFDQSFNYYIKDIFNFKPSQNGLIKFITGLFAVGLNVILMRSKSKDSFGVKLLARLILVMGLTAVCVSFIPSEFGFVSVSLLWFAGYTVMIPVLQNTVLSRKTNVSEGNQLAGLYNSLLMFGKIFGALLTSLVYTLSPVSSFIISGIVFLISFGYLVIKKGLFA